MSAPITEAKGIDDPFANDLERLNAIRASNGRGCGGDPDDGLTPNEQSIEFLLGFIDNLWREYSRVSSSATASGDLQVGSFTLRASPDPEFILMRHESGEGGSFKTANLEQALFKFFGEQF